MDLSDIGSQLTAMKKPEDAIPILQRCVTLDQDAAFCWVDLGEAGASLGRRFEAKAFWKKAIGIGGFDKINALAIERGKRDLASLEDGEKMCNELRHPPTPPTDRIRILAVMCKNHSGWGDLLGALGSRADHPEKPSKGRLLRVVSQFELSRIEDRLATLGRVARAYGAKE
jgi:tetratricopeptide (TPR) repeat protein